MSKFFKALEQAQRDRDLREDEPFPKAPVRSEARPSPSVVDAPRIEEAADPAHLRVEGPAGTVEEHLVSLVSPVGIEAEQYRTLRSVLERAPHNGRSYVVAVSSPTAGDGKTTTALNLAGAFAQSRDASVLLVDADLRAPAVSARLGLDQRAPGLVDLARSPALGLDDVVRFLPRFNLSVLPAGRSSASPYDVLNTPRLKELIDDARSRFDCIVVDTTPLVGVSDCRLISSWVDGFLVIVAAHRTPRKLLEEAMAMLDRDKYLGIVFNAADTPPGGYSGYYYSAKVKAPWWRKLLGT